MECWLLLEQLKDKACKTIVFLHSLTTEDLFNQCALLDHLKNPLMLTILFL